MIERTKGNLLEADAEALINTVNCVGVMGKGIALQFKNTFETNFKEYERACKTGLVKPGHMFIVPTGRAFNPRYIINFPTKRHWKGKSKLEDVQSGLDALIADIKRLGITSIAVPPLGCGNGGLDWADVEPMIEAAFAEVPDVKVLLFPPQAPPKPQEQAVSKTKAMTIGRALMLWLLKHYNPDSRTTKLEAQKLAYFLFMAGQPGKLKFEPHHYGPYSPQVDKVLRDIEGVFIYGWGDGTTGGEIRLLDGAMEAATPFIEDDPEAARRLRRVEQLTEGYRTPKGMELLGTVLMAAHMDPLSAVDVDAAIAYVHGWSARKRQIFGPESIRTAWHHLDKFGWLDPLKGDAYEPPMAAES